MPIFALALYGHKGLCNGRSMIKEINIKAYGPIQDFHSQGVENINLLIGHNGVGKTVMLKALYSALKTVEQYRRGREPRGIREILAENLYWTFQLSSLGSIVKKGQPTLSFSMSSDKDEQFSYSFGNSTVREVKTLDNSFEPTVVNSIFIPAKEVVSLQDSILRLYEVDKIFGFDKTYVDLARAMSKTVQGRNYKEFSEARAELNDALGGKLEYDSVGKAWVFRDREKRMYDIMLTSEGIKRLSILELLLGNHYLSKDSIVIIDEAEANLHPEMVARFMKVIFLMAQAGVQFFISTHSYFVIKNLYILSQEHKVSIPTWSFDKDGVIMSDLKQGMPDNAIIRESVNLYKREIAL